MKSILVIDRTTRLLRSLRSLADVLDIPIVQTTRMMEVRQHYSTGNVGMIIANSGLPSIRIDDLLQDLELIRRRNKLDDIPIYFLLGEHGEELEDLIEDMPADRFISRESSMEIIYHLMEAHLLKAESSGEGGFHRFSDEHEQFLSNFQRWVDEFRRIVASAEAKLDEA